MPKLKMSKNTLQAKLAIKTVKLIAVLSPLKLECNCYLDKLCSRRPELVSCPPYDTVTLDTFWGLHGYSSLSRSATSIILTSE